MEEEIPFEVNRWGSCQYSGALWYFDKFREYRKELTLQMTLEKMMADVSWGYIADFPYVKEKFLEFLAEEIEQWKDEEGEEEYIQELKDYQKQLTEYDGPYVDKFFNVLRNMAWDLWGAAPLIASMVFDDFKFSAPDAPGIGPKFNILAQNENFRVGLCCALLAESFFIKDPDEAFGGFDT